MSCTRSAAGAPCNTCLASAGVSCSMGLPPPAFNTLRNWRTEEKILKSSSGRIDLFVGAICEVFLVNDVVDEACFAESKQLLYSVVFDVNFFAISKIFRFKFQHFKGIEKRNKRLFSVANATISQCGILQKPANDLMQNSHSMNRREWHAAEPLLYFLQK